MAETEEHTIVIQCDSKELNMLPSTILLLWLSEKSPDKLEPSGRTGIAEVHGGLSPVREISQWNRGRVWGVHSLKKEQQRTDQKPHSPSPALLRRDE